MIYNINILVEFNLSRYKDPRHKYVCLNDTLIYISLEK